MKAKQNLLAWCWSALLMIIMVFQVEAQQSSKVIFPTPSGFDLSYSQDLRPTNDGGYILTGTAFWNDYQFIPRLIKVNAEGNIEWENTYYIQGQSPTGSGGGRSRPSAAAMPVPAGGYIMSVHDDTLATDIMRIADDGTLLFHQDLGLRYVKLLDVEADGFWVFGLLQQDLMLRKLDFQGNLITQLSTGIIPSYETSVDGTRMGNGDFIFMHQNSNAKFIYTRIDPAGNQIWQSAPLLTGGQSIEGMANGDFTVCWPYSGFRLYRFNGQGALQWTAPTDLIPGYATNLKSYPDGSLLVSGNTLASRGYMAKLGLDGSIIWLAQTPLDAEPDIAWLSGFPSDDGWAVGAGYTIAPEKMAFVRIQENTGLFINTLNGRVANDADHSCTVESGEPGIQNAHVSASNGAEQFIAFAQANGAYTMFVPAGQYTLTATTNQPFFEQCGDISFEANFPSGTSNTLSIDLPMQAPEPIHHVTGKVSLDDNGNCQDDTGELPLIGWVIRLSSGANILSEHTDANGHYSFFVPDGSYQVEVIPLNPNFGICSPAIQTAVFSSDIGQELVLDFIVNKAVECSFMRGYISSTAMRPCTQTTIYAGYNNTGTVVAEDASMKVTLDPALSFVSSIPAPTSINGQELTFSLGNVSPGSHLQFFTVNIKAQVSCDAQIGQELCVSSEVYPDTICYGAENWNGAIVAVEGTCIDDSEVLFKIRNVGNAPNSVQRNYVIIEDQIVLLSDGFQLNPGDSLEITIPADGDPLTIIADQEPNYPGAPEVGYTVSNCNGFSTTPTVFSGPAGPFSSQVCFPVTNSFDPNDKAVTPQGYGDDHAIEPGGSLEYRVRFQNTGNDTAFLVVIRDTLSPFLDPRSVVPGLSSHPYEFLQVNDSILHFTFRNILLPDSTTNLEGSQGFVSFSARQRQGIALGSVIENTAAIYFDFNTPVMTNTTWNTVREFLIVSVDQPKNAVSEERVKVFPNPVAETAQVALINAPTGLYQISIMDAAGKLISRQSFEEPVYTFSRNNMQGGMYFWQITIDGTPWASGKLVLSKE